MGKTLEIGLEQIEEMDEIKFKLLEFIKSNNGVSRQDINNYMYPFFNTTNQKELNNKTRYIITFLREHGLIYNKGTTNKPKWVSKE